jgi:hypothetical protein
VIAGVDIAISLIDQDVQSSHGLLLQNIDGWGNIPISPTDQDFGAQTAHACVIGLLMEGDYTH